MLGLKSRRLAQLSVAGSAVALGGCTDRAFDFGDSGFEPDPTVDPDPTTNPDPTTDPDPTGDPTSPPPPPDVPGPPQLIDVQFVDNLTLQLTFTEAIAPTTAVDPRQFRLSAAFSSQSPQYGPMGTFYQEVGLWNGTEECYEYCCPPESDYCYEECYEFCYQEPGPPVRVIALTQFAERPEILWLSFDAGISPNVCEALSGAPEDFVVALFIHYTASGAAPVTDNAGQLLASISEKWVLSPDLDSDYVEGFFPFMNPMLPIPCPF